MSYFEFLQQHDALSYAYWAKRDALDESHTNARNTLRAEWQAQLSALRVAYYAERNRDA